MFSGFKTRPSSNNLRAVPYGGLGGCVEVGNDSPKFEYGFQYEVNQHDIRRKPYPIHVQTLDIPRGPRSSPMMRSEPVSSITPRTPFTALDIPTSISENAVDGLSPFDLWDRCKASPWFTSRARKSSSPLTPVRKQPRSPIELPAELPWWLQSDCQPGQNQSPVSAARPPRSSPTSNHTKSQSQPLSLRVDCVPASQSTTKPRPSFTSPLQKALPDLPPPTPVLPVSDSKPFALTGISQLLHELPGLGARDVTERWMVTMEKELARLRSYIFGFNSHNGAHRAMLRPFCEEIQRILKEAKVMCDEHNEEFRVAQESTDANRESDLLKIMRMQKEFRDAMASLKLFSWQQKACRDKIDSIRTMLLRSIQVISGFIRNQMTMQLHYQYGGLSDGMVQILRGFDRGSSVNQHESATDQQSKSSHGSHIDMLSSTNATHDTSARPSVEITKSTQDSAVNNKSRRRVKAKRTRAEVYYIEADDQESQEILQSYFDMLSDSEGEDEKEEQTPKCKTQTAEPEKEPKDIPLPITPLEQLPLENIDTLIPPASVQALISISPVSPIEVVPPTTTSPVSPEVEIPPPEYTLKSNSDDKPDLPQQPVAATHRLSNLHRKIEHLESQNLLLQENLQILMTQMEQRQPDAPTPQYTPCMEKMSHFVPPVTEMTQKQGSGLGIVIGTCYTVGKEVRIGKRADLLMSRRPRWVQV